jgi:site-specific DNA-methyltransferase (adenine-specific)
LEQRKRCGWDLATLSIIHPVTAKAGSTAKCGMGSKGNTVQGRERVIGPARLVLGDCIQGMASLSDHSYDLAIADPPYGASTSAEWKLGRGHGLAGMGGEWKLADHSWDLFSGVGAFGETMKWLTQLRRLVRPSGSIWIHGTYHNIGFVNVACQMLGLEIINEVVWYKRNAFPNLAARRLTASHESLLWVHTGGSNRRYRFNYDNVKAASFAGDSMKLAGKQLRTVWDIPNNKAKDELRCGQHPTQKPLRLLDRLFLISGVKGGTCLVPFMGSGSDMVAAIRGEMEPTGFETDQQYFDLSCKRVEAELVLRDSNPALCFEAAENA